MKKKLLITFPTTYDSIKAEEVLKQHDVSLRVRPVPREISSDCGLAIQCELDIEEQALRFLKENEVEVEGIHYI
ncbi:DUF3343 domain-containing protein [Proteinivorax tanatarense]|uniref:DUF3343 domain-containing protein n=1 Tax=Proteinivorax tanatarense TaxID=1260629 RepID=A0AAU7VLS0_9FIRM